MFSRATRERCKPVEPVNGADVSIETVKILLGDLALAFRCNHLHVTLAIQCNTIHTEASLSAAIH